MVYELSKKNIGERQVVKEWLFSILIFFSFFNSVALFYIEDFDFEVKPHYIIIVVLLIGTIISGKFVIPSKPLLVFGLYVILNAMFNAFVWGFSNMFYNYIFAVLFLISYCSLGKNFSFDSWLVIFRRAAILMLIVVYVNTFLHYNAILYFLAHISWMGHPFMESISGGGVNLDATWIGIMALCFYNHKFKWLYLILGFVISVLYASRAGLLANVFCLILLLTMSFKEKGKSKLLRVTIFSGVCVVFMGAIASGLFDALLSRFMNIGNESGSLERLNMWIPAFEIVKTYPFGVGVGNTILALEGMTGINYYVENLHNLPYQMFCETGWIGGIFFLIIIITFLVKERKAVLNNPFVGMLYSYILLSFLQFRGAEVTMLCILGAYLCLKHSPQENVYSSKQLLPIENKYK